MNKASRQCIVSNKRGLHARAAARFMEHADAFEADVHVVCNGERVAASSIMDLLMLGCEQGKEITLEAHGPDAEHALEKLGSLVEGGFGEE